MSQETPVFIITGEPEDLVQECRLALALLAGDDEYRCLLAHRGKPPLQRVEYGDMGLSRPGSGLTVGETFAPEYMDILLWLSYKILLLLSVV